MGPPYHLQCTQGLSSVLSGWRRPAVTNAPSAHTVLRAGFKPVCRCRQGESKRKEEEKLWSLEQGCP